LTADELKSLVRTVPDFPVTGIQFRDITTLVANGAGLAAAIDALVVKAKALDVQAVAGIEARGFIFGAALALRLGLGFIPLRKAGKLPVPVIAEDYALEYGHARLECDPVLVSAGQNVLLIDDLLATGGTALAGASLLRRAGAKCRHAMFVIDLPELGGAAALRNADIQCDALMAFPGH
jgi:adenine phosphoribosyltransferase